ncbi:MAG: META domain-containing protein, partial [Anaerolineae bacterium]|nr:META domain-containing protein [Anaerolineae bacterium]
AVVGLLVLSLAVTWRSIVRRAWPGGTPVATPAPAADLAGTEWVLTTLNGAPLAEGTHITLNLYYGEATGFAGCNRYTVHYTLTGEGALSVGSVSVTAAKCPQPEGVMEQEQAYVDALRSVASYRLGDGRLELRDAAGNAILSFQERKPLSMDPADLVGTEWQLVSWDGRALIEGSRLTIAFAEGEVRGEAGCRGYTGIYEASGDHIRFPMLSMSETEPACSEDLLRQEGDYTTSLGWVSHYRLGSGQLELLTERGETLAYEPVPAAEWRTYTDSTYGVWLQIPAHWAPIKGYDARYGGPDGYFDLSARAGAPAIDEVVASETGHKLEPYGSSPTIEALTVRGQEARLILPSADQHESMEQRALLIVRYPQPVTIRGGTFEYLLLGADKGHIRELAATLEFFTSVDAGPVEGWTGTLVKECAMAQFDDYFQRDDGLRCGVEGATEEVEAEIERLRCRPGTQVRLWGRLQTEIMDVNSRRIVVERLEVVETPPTPTPWPGPSEEAVDGWEGQIVPCGEGGAQRSFLRSDGARLPIEGVGAEAREALYIAECEGYPVRVWGTLYRQAASLRILADRLERQEASATATPALDPTVAARVRAQVAVTAAQSVQGRPGWRIAGWADGLRSHGY